MLGCKPKLLLRRLQKRSDLSARMRRRKLPQRLPLPLLRIASTRTGRLLRPQIRKTSRIAGMPTPTRRRRRRHR